MYKFVINLKRRPDRLNNFKNNCPYPIGTVTKTSFTGQLLSEKPSFGCVNVIYGFDAKQVANEIPEEQFLYKDIIKLVYPGAIGCFISHLRIYNLVVENNYPGAVIFEDDANFSPDFDKKLKRLIKQLPKDYHIAYIGGRFTQDFKMKPTSITPVSDNICQHNTTDWYNLDHDRTTHGYIISNLGAKFLLDKFLNTTIDKQGAIDFWLMNTFLNNNIKVYSSVPLICWSPITGDSDIR